MAELEEGLLFPKEEWDSLIREEKCEEGLLFPKEKWNDLIKWQPVSNISIDEIYKDLPEAKEYHKAYVKLWLKGR